MKEYAEMNKKFKNAKIAIKKIELDLNDLIKEAKGTPRGEKPSEHYRDVMSEASALAHNLTNVAQSILETVPLAEKFIEALEEKERNGGSH